MNEIKWAKEMVGSRDSYLVVIGSELFVGIMLIILFLHSLEIIYMILILFTTAYPIMLTYNLRKCVKKIEYQERMLAHFRGNKIQTTSPVVDREFDVNEE